MSIEITDPSGNPLTGLTFTLERGVPSAAIPIRIENTGISAVSGLQMVMYAEETPGSGNYLSSGHPAVDEIMGRVQITSVNSSATPGQTFIPGVAQPMGHLQNALLPRLLAGDDLFADVWLEQPALSAGGGAVNIKFEIGNDSKARAVPEGLSVVARGVDPGTNQAKSFPISGRALTATPGDDEVHVAAGSWLLGGVAYTDASVEDLTLDQDDGASVALASGEEYLAVISQGAASVPTVTKGLKDVVGSAVEPDLPTGELFLGLVKVSYQAGSSVIGSGDVTQNTLVYGRFLAIAPTSGLSITLHAGEAIAANYRQTRSDSGTVALTGSVTNRIWLLPSGTVVATTTADQPSPGALLLWEAVTDGTHVTTLTDKRTFIGAAGALSPHASTHATAGSDPLAPGDIGAATTADLALKADINDPALTGTPTAPTASTGTDTTQIATTAFVQQEIAAVFSDQTDTWTSDGTTTSFTLSPVPSATSVPLVIVGNQVYLEGVDYTRTGTNSETIDWTGHVPTVGAIVYFRWRG